MEYAAAMARVLALIVFGLLAIKLSSLVVWSPFLYTFVVVMVAVNAAVVDVALKRWLR